MVETLSWVLIGLALLSALSAVLLAVLNRRVNWSLLGLLGVLELGLLAQLVVGVVQLAGTDRPVSGVVFVIYLVVALLVLPIGTLWALAEESRWGAGALAVACLVTPVVVLRLDQLWSVA